MPRVLLNALLHGTEAPLLCWKMASRKLRWQLLRQQPLSFAPLDKLGQKAFAKQHSARVPRTLWRGGRSEVGAWLRSDAPPESFCLKPTHGYQNRNAFVVEGGQELLRRRPWDAAAATRQVESDGGFDEYVAEELVRDVHGAALPTDYKFWCFGGTVAHVTIMTGRHRADANAYGYGVTYADCDEDYREAPTWCAAVADAESGSVRVALEVMSGPEATHGPPELGLRVPSSKGASGSIGTPSTRLLALRSSQVPLPPRPACWPEMVGVARALGAAAGVFTRVDLYASTDGPVFGEFQCLFDLRDWNRACDDAIRAHWRGWDGAEG